MSPVLQVLSNTRAVDVVTEQLLEDAVTNAVQAYKAGRPGWAEYLLAKAALKVARLTDCAASIEQLGDLVYIEAGSAPVLVDGCEVSS